MPQYSFHFVRLYMFSTVSVRRTTFRLSNRDEVRDVVAHRTPNRLYGVCILNFSILKSKMAADPIITTESAKAPAISSKILRMKLSLWKIDSDYTTQHDKK